MLFHPAALRNGETSAGFGITIATAWRYVSETVALPAARSPKLRRAGTGRQRTDRAGGQGICRRRRARARTYRGRNKRATCKEANRARAQLRSPGERASAQLKIWRISRKLPLLPLEGRAARQSHPRFSSPRIEG